MASIFTFDPDPPSVSSPWVASEFNESSKLSKPLSDMMPLSSRLGYHGDKDDTHMDAIGHTNIKRLEAEPQEGPTEYKLHLLLRRRRSFVYTTTGQQGHRISGSLRKSDNSIPATVSSSSSSSGSSLLPNMQTPLNSTQSKQHRLEQLTTQLLWRLQQSCSFHMSSSNNSVIPQFPHVSQLSAPKVPQRLLPGLEESQGALYEIGIADDGTLIGLAEDEMEESLDVLRAMAASLGCQVNVQRRVPVGHCEWVEFAGTPQQRLQSSQLWVAEALVHPAQHLLDDTRKAHVHDLAPATTVTSVVTETEMADSVSLTPTEQLRVSLTGATMSGKSSLLGTLSTATLDNGRGKSRLSLLKHRHEIASGMTSSVTQELLGYRDEIKGATQVISFGSGDVSSWVDIHAAVENAENGRLVFLSDSAGHPRFRRTTVRGIVGWQPHWTLLCVPADETDGSSRKIGASPTSQDILGPGAADVDLSHAHLQLCLSLELPLVIVVTKYDLATKAGLRQTLSKLFSALKSAGRRPCIVSDTSTAVEADLHTVHETDRHEADGIVQLLQTSPLAAVPVLLTSAVKGTGIQKLHAFLRQLPIPSQPTTPPPSCPCPLFHIEDIYTARSDTSPDRSIIIGGYLRYGSLSIGSELLLGPYPTDTPSDDSDTSTTLPPTRKPHLPPSPRSYPGAIAHPRRHDAPHCEWRRVKITSLRNLRLPVRVLHPGHMATIAILPVDDDDDDSPATTPATTPRCLQRIRKGMVMLMPAPAPARQPVARKALQVRFEGRQAHGVRCLGVGCAVVVYVDSVRASSKIVGIAGGALGADGKAEAKEEEKEAHELAHGDSDTKQPFGVGYGLGRESGQVRRRPGAAAAALRRVGLGLAGEVDAVLVRLQFIASKEFVESGAKVLVMPGGGGGGGGMRVDGGGNEGWMAGLEGYVGRVVDW